MKNALTKNADLISSQRLYSRHEDCSYRRPSSLSSNRRLYLHTMDSEKFLAEKLTLLIVDYLKKHGLPGYNESKTVDALIEPLRIEKERVIKKHRLAQEDLDEGLQRTLDFIGDIENLIGGGSNNGENTHRDKDGGRGTNDAHGDKYGGDGTNDTHRDKGGSHDTNGAHAIVDSSYPSPLTPLSLNTENHFFKAAKDQSNNDRGKPHKHRRRNERDPILEASYPDLGQPRDETTTPQEKAFFAERIKPSSPGRVSSSQSKSRAGAKRKTPHDQQVASTPPDSELRRSDRPTKKINYSK